MFFRWLHHKSLVRKGLACDKTRRRNQSGWIEDVEHNLAARSAIFASFTGLLILVAWWGVPSVSLPDFLLLALIFAGSLILFEIEGSERTRSNFHLLLIYGTILGCLFISKSIYLWVASQETIHSHTAMFLIPAALAPLLLTLLRGTRLGIFGALFFSLFNAVVLSAGLISVTISLVIGLTAVFYTRGARNRADLMKAGVALAGATLVCAVGLGLANELSWTTILQVAAIGACVGIATSMVVSAILPVFEYLFEIVTDISWVEMADLNHPLLQQMTIEAPGTYHHSLVVANLVEGAAKSIGLNPTKCRVLALFHDIGKLIKPEYFTENIPQGENPHANLSPTMSALIIIAHVKEGVDLAIQHALKQPIVDGIQQHHGDTLVYYFYKRAKQMEEDAREGGRILNVRDDDIPEVSESSFRYPGPIPKNPENGILALADSIEAASRSLDKPTAARIEQFVNEFVKRRINEGLLDDSGLTLNEIRQAAESFTFTLKSMLHSRVSYPKDEKEKSTRNGSASKGANGKREDAPARTARQRTTLGAGGDVIRAGKEGSSTSSPSQPSASSRRRGGPPT